MKWIVRMVSYVGLGLTLVPAFFVLTGSLSETTYKTLMLVGTLCWLGSAPFWIFQRQK